MSEVLTFLGLDFDKELLQEYMNDDFFTPPASGSSKFESMTISPCSMKTLSAVANGFSDSLITRAADVSLKEGRKLLLVPRETPFSQIHLENMIAASRAGAVIVPPVPGFYNFPESIDDVINFINGKILNILGIDHDLLKEWGK